MISVIIPLYNHADSILKTLISLTHQSYQDFEVIIVNDGSTDNPQNIIQSFQAQNPSIKLKYLEQTNQGSNPARNNGFKEASGDFLLFCDADVALRKDALKDMLEALLKYPEASYSYGSFRLGFKTFKGRAFSEDLLRKEPYIHTTALIRAKDFPGFDNEIKRFQDWDLWLTMLENNKKGIFIDKILMDIGESRHISVWLPSFFYKLFPNNEKVVKYNQAKEIIFKKHHL